VDGSEISLRAVQHVLGLRESLREPEALELHLLNVQRPVSGDVSSFIASKSLEDYYRETAEEALAPSRELLQGAGAGFEAHHRVGVPGLTIAQEATALACDLVVMGTRGLGAAGALLGSVAQHTIERSSVPVMLVK
jgi:nucleotide-binding universal stress UspA family protein